MKTTIESDDMPDLTPAEGRRVVLSPERGWDVLIEHDRKVVSITHCSEWHRVERCGVPVVAPGAANADARLDGATQRQPESDALG